MPSVHASGEVGEHADVVVAQDVGDGDLLRISQPVETLISHTHLEIASAHRGAPV